MHHGVAAKNLFQYLLANVQPDFQNVVIAGHSHGGKVEFGVALGKSKNPPLMPYAALVRVDPMDGTLPPIVCGKEAVNMPTLIVGSGSGPVKKNCCCPPCASACVNHMKFFRLCSPPAYHFVAIDYGHMDFLDDITGGVKGKTSYCFCKNGLVREPIRRFTGGILVAFLNASLRKETDDLEELIKNPSLSPVRLDPPQYIALPSVTV